MENKKGQTGGLVTGLIFGIASLVIGVIIAFVLVSTLTDANLLGADSTKTNSVTNETGAWINSSGYTLSGYNSTWTSPTLTAIWTNTQGSPNTYNFSMELTNATTSSVGVVTNLTSFNLTIMANASLSYTYTYTFDNIFETSADRLDTNFTSGVDQISGKLPTVLLVAAIVLILAVLAILVGVWQRMRLGTGGNL